MYQYRVKYSGKKKTSTVSDVLTICSPYNLNDNNANAAYVIYQIRYELQKNFREFEIDAIEVDPMPAA